MFEVAGDVLQHHDCVVDHEAGRDGQRHQGEIVQAEAQQVHHAEGSDQRDRDRDTRNQRDPNVAQEEIDDQDHQGDRDQQRDLDVVDRGADGGRPVQHQGHLDGRWDRRLQLGQRRQHPVHGGDNVGARLAEDDDQDGLFRVYHPGVAQILDGIVYLRDIGQPHRGAVVPGHNQGPVLLRFEQLIGYAQRRG